MNKTIIQARNSKNKNHSCDDNFNPVQSKQWELGYYLVRVAQRPPSWCQIAR
ncbi:hypothetical protein F511_20656 [Dorcoceras hygrometricum]|uniref:Uncharacterized protein n=1 Tax=Dorcoceras hygrometricum TaxID=472368 RepID=A0A2Z7DBM1_9LAMI|nr:hypothetical protein F511_20656 [Dorcoceras hygrometricum]